VIDFDHGSRAFASAKVPSVSAPVGEQRGPDGALPSRDVVYQSFYCFGAGECAESLMDRAQIRFRFATSSVGTLNRA
jgi:hypothetical protein